MEAGGHGIGAKLRALRKHRRLTLGALGKRTGYSVSALSKMENDRLGFSYDKLYRLAVALEVDMSTLFGDSPQQSEPPRATGRRSLAPKGSGKKVVTRNYTYDYISPELSRKQMVPIIVRPHASSLDEFGPLIRHGGEEWIYVIKGEIEVNTEFYAPEILREGDSIYLDCRMGHAYINKSKVPAMLVCICSAPEAELLDHAESDEKAPSQKNSQARTRQPRARARRNTKSGRV
ncbi:MAG: helix-turn-helix transcriptional regulator [Proteobacteria bacterium]|nr:helix-turn-helix transcriptional regulator [Pseudomonadota bacterium]